MKHRYTGHRKVNIKLTEMLSAICQEHSALLRFIAPDTGRVIVEINKDNDTVRDVLAYDLRAFAGQNTGITYIIV
jgi:hypothetical protein